jgi:leucyl/phenylalanyl-tRNA--protein transferase
VARLNAGGFQLLDTQFLTDHLKSLGAYEIPRDHYQKLLAESLEFEADFETVPPEKPLSGTAALELAAPGK